MSSTSPVHQIVTALGSSTIAERLGVSVSSIRAAKRDRLFPARWYAPLLDMCEQHGVPCPIEAFRWIETDTRESAA